MLSDSPVRIAGLGRYLPKRIVETEEIARIVGEPCEVIKERSGVHRRHWADLRAGESNTFMGREAALEAIADAGIEIGDVDLILNASGTQLQAIPDGAVHIQQALGLGRSGVPSFSVHATCLSFVPALEIAARALVAGGHRHVLVVSSEVASVGLNPKHVESMSLMGDGAAAVILTRTPEGESSCIHALRLETFGDSSDLTRIDGGGSKRHPNHPETTPEDNLFHMDGAGVLKVALREVPRWLDRLEPGLRARLPELQTIIPHQASRVGLALLERLGVRPEALVRTLGDLGNVIAASIPLTLYEAVRSGRLRRGERAMLLGTGAGLSIGGATFTY